MADNYKLSLTAEEIDERLANALLATEQTLTEEQQAQVRSNIGAAAGLPKVTLTTVATADGAVLSDEETAALAAAAENGVFILECTAQAEETQRTLYGITISSCDHESDLAAYELRFRDGEYDWTVMVLKQPFNDVYIWGVIAFVQ